MTSQIHKRTQNLLIVDDEPANIEVLIALLEDQYEIFFATSGDKALEIVDSHDVDLILLDVMMPIKSGLQVCKELKESDIHQHIPIIFVTAMSDAEDETRGFELGAVDYITKPFRPAIVQARVRTHMELKRQRDYLHAITTLDGLTGIANRRHFDQAFALQCDRAKHRDEPISLVLLDIDHFKQYNDTYGHLAGDDCLRRVAKALDAVLTHPSHSFARFGGEEFVGLMPNTPLSEAGAIAQNLRRTAAELQIPHSGSSVADHVTVSLGCTTRLPEDAWNSQQIIENADELLYEAKRQGRNRVVTRNNR